MKKLLGILSLLLLMGCASEAVETGSTTDTIEVAKTEVIDTQQAVDEYKETIVRYFRELSGEMEVFSNLTGDAGRNPSLMFSEVWIADSAYNIFAMDEIISKIYHVPAPPEMEEVHGKILKAMDEYQYVVDNYPTAVDNKDPDLLMLCMDAMGRGTEYLQQANNLIQ